MLKRITAIITAALIFVMCCVPCASAATFTIDEKITSQAVYLLNLDTETVVFERNSEKKMYPASTTKIMTYIIVVENVSDLNGEKVLVDKEILDKLIGTGSSLSNLEYFVGQYVTVYDLLNCLMVKSGNDAALLLAHHIGEGSIQKFIDMMNAKAEELGCENTHFMNPHGLHDEDHYTTASDLAVITRYAQTLPYFNEITNTLTAYLSVDTAKEYPLISTNYMINETSGGDYYYPYAKGIKTGTTDEAGYCLVSTANYSGYTYLCVVMGSPCIDSNGKQIETNGAMMDSRTLYKWAFTHLEIKSVISEQTPVCEIPVQLAWDQDTVLLVPQKAYSTILPTDVEPSSIDISVNIPESLTAPVIEGTVIGTATISYANQELTTVDLIASETVERSKILYFLDYATKVLHSRYVLIAAIVVVLLLIFYIIVTIAYNNRKKRNKAMKDRKKRRRKKGTTNNK
ncbi:MAG: D-alanyl-D-alanine carboxypeptidase family protein [Acutalibacteraceae bacterium]|nr:D-alanyl-D-alanine carboxypeptidase [Clostridia bacterium]MEE3450935.1 D-alanyl-D-alanine carboxypeptidase family protein [Acutalibacteraceae bacterium]